MAYTLKQKVIFVCEQCNKEIPGKKEGQWTEYATQCPDCGSDLDMRVVPVDPPQEANCHAI